MTDEVLRVAHSEPDFMLLRWGHLFIALFRGPLVPRHMEIARPIAYDAIREAVNGGALLSIFESSASEQGQESRALAAELFEDAGRAVRAVAIVYEGRGGSVAALQDRSRDVITRAGTPAPVAMFDAVAPAAKWVLETSKLGTDADARALVAALERTRVR